MNWQPIETAPHNEEDVLVCAVRDGTYWFATAQWDDGEWFFMDGRDTGPVPLHFEPAYWMPAPAPPDGENWITVAGPAW